MTADAEHRDALPEDLDVTALVGPYEFPDNARRRTPAILYVVLGAAVAGLTVATGPEAVLTNQGLLLGAVGLVVWGGYHALAGFPLKVDQTHALEAATVATGFAVGHASAQMGWRGLRSRPTWRILLYSAEDPPAKRGLVLVDGVDAEVIHTFIEDNPEDWSALGAR